MKNTLFKKGLVVGIIALFIGLVFIPSFNAISNFEDSTPPVTNISLNGTMSEFGIFTSDVEVTLNATDDMSGVNVTYYRLDIGELDTYIEPFMVTGHAWHVLAYWSVDNAGNIENTKFVYIEIDLIPPEIELYWNKLDNKSVIFEPYIVDLGSGIDKVEYYIDNNLKYTAYSGDFCWLWTPNNTGRFLVSGVVYDRAGYSARDDIYINIPRDKAMSISNDVEEDCFECKSNNNHLAEKLLNRLEKDEVISNVINMNSPDDDTPICEFLYTRMEHIEDILYYYAEQLHKYENNSLMYMIYFSIWSMHLSRMITICLTALYFNCDWMHPYYP